MAYTRITKAGEVEVLKTALVPEELNELMRKKLFEDNRSYNSMAVEAIANYCGVDPAKYLTKRWTGNADKKTK